MVYAPIVSISMLFLLVLVPTYSAWPSPVVLMGDIAVQNPTLAKSGDTYYLLSSHDQIQTRVSTDRIKWAYIGSAINFFGNADLWSPDITLHNDTYWLYYCRSTFGTRLSEIYLATSTTLEPKSWDDEGVIIGSSNFTLYNAIDPAAIQDESGQWWLVFGSWNDGIYIFKVDNYYGQRISTPQKLAQRPNKALEKPLLVFNGGYYYLFMSFGNCCPSSTGVLLPPQEKYHIVACKSRRIEGPYVDDKGISCLEGGGYEVLQGHDKYWAVGGQAVYHDTADDHDLLVYHWYDSTDSYTAKLGINFLNWTSGLPVAY